MLLTAWMITEQCANGEGPFASQRKACDRDKQFGQSLHGSQRSPALVGYASPHATAWFEISTIFDHIPDCGRGLVRKMTRNDQIGELLQSGHTHLTTSASSSLLAHHTAVLSGGENESS